MLGPTAVRGITQMVSAVDIGGRLGFKARHIAVTRCLDLLRQRAYSVSRAATPEYGRRPVRRSGPSPEKGGAPQRGQRIDKGAAACCYLERAAGRRIVISDKSLRTVRVYKRRAYDTRCVTRIHSDSPGEHELTEVAQCVVIDVVRDRAGALVHSNQSRASAAAARVRASVLIHGQPPVDDLTAPLPHGLCDGLAIRLNLIGDPGSARCLCYVVVAVRKL